jgi:uncharacterized protein YgbK (DUF1537 family)
MLGCIADDVTGATDLAINLVQGGMCVVQMLGVPSVEELSRVDADAIVVALKTRSTPREAAIAQSLEGLEALRGIGIDRFFFKYCSTFDSTEQGNIGPVASAMMNALSVEQTIFCPAFPRNGRTLYQGHLFVNGRLLHESGMESHPLNPMTDANLVRFLGKQTDREVGLLSYELYSDGNDLGQHLLQLAAAGVSMVITDACDDRHLDQLAHAVVGMRLVTGGSGIARYLPDAYRDADKLNSPAYEPTLPEVAGRGLILSGSCSAATNRQVEWMRERCPTWRIDVPSILRDRESSLSATMDWAQQTGSHEPLLVYSTSPPEEVVPLQAEFGANRVAQAIEQFLADVAQSMVSELGVRRLVLAGGETAGAVVSKLGVRSLRVGPEICAGVPWTETSGPPQLALALKSGNFGEESFFAAALEMLP